MNEEINREADSGIVDSDNAQSMEQNFQNMQSTGSGNCRCGQLLRRGMRKGGRGMNGGNGRRSKRQGLGGAQVINDEAGFNAGNGFGQAKGFGKGMKAGCRGKMGCGRGRSFGDEK